MPDTFYVVSHTHWDREWYLTFQEFRMRLVDLVDNLLALLDRDLEFRSFHLDAQTIVLEDYLEIKPHNRQKLEQYIRAGRIVVGPWYQLNDEFLTSGEATIRSLLIGSRIARQFGICAQIGYLPDQFGNISQMPQIFRGFGIDNAVLGRGYQLVGDRKMEFRWQSPDGSQVTASLMAFWYNNAQHIPADSQEALQYIERLRDQMEKHAAVPHLLLMNGVDHLEAQQDLSPILAAVQQRLPQGERILHATIEQYTDALKNAVETDGVILQTHVGELRDDRGGSVLAGTLSTRMYIKQANHHAQITLEKFVEPFASFAMQAGSLYPAEFLRYAWKLLMKNHPHDSICGCSIDQVHREMMPRFAQVEQIGEELISRSLSQIANRVDGVSGTALVVFNALNWSRTDPVHATLVFPLGVPTRGNPPRDDSHQVNGITITDEAGNIVPFAVTRTEVKMRQVLSPVELPLDQWVQEITVEFIAQDVPACGYTTYRVHPAGAMSAFAPLRDALDPCWQPVYEDCGEVGDEYLHRKPTTDRRLLQPGLDASYSEEQNTVRVTRTYSADWKLPLSATADASSRSTDPITCPITTQVTRWRGCPRIEFTTTFDNHARDHRLRVLFQNSGETFHPQPHSIAEGQFDVLYRPLTHPLEAEGASPFHPQQNWVALVGKYGNQDETNTITVINHGLPEYEIYPSPDSPSIAVTLLRSVNYLSRRGDGPQIETPEAQCLGLHTFHYALLETPGNWQDGQVWKQAYQFNVPLRAVQTGPQVEPQQPALPPVLSFITLEPDSLVITAIKQAEEDPSLLIVRFFNVGDNPVSCGRITVRNAVAAHITNLNEEIQETLAIEDDGSITLETIAPKEIVTLAFRLNIGFSRR